MDATIVTGIAIVLLLILMATGVPVAFAMGICGVVGLLLAGGANIAFNALGTQLYSAPYSFVLTAIPLFVLMAQFIIYTGLGAELFKAAEAVLARLPGRLGVAALGSGTAFAAVTGLSIASCATIGPVAIKEMVERKYDRSFASGVIAASGGLAVIIPPSVLFILYGFIAEVSVAKLFLAGVFPGLLMALGYAIVIYVWSRHNPMVAPPGPVLRGREAVTSALRGLPVLIIGLVVLVFIYTGVTTVAESAAVGVVGAFILAVAFRRLTLKGIRDSLLHTASTGGFYLMILVGALTFGYMFTYLRVPIALTEYILSLGLNQWVIFVLINLFILVLGMFLDGTSVLLLVFPIILAPLRALGFDPIWLGVILAINLEMGFTTPPFGINLFVIQGTCKEWDITYSQVVRGAVPFLLSDAVVLLLVVLVPNIALWLPNTMN